LTEDPEQEHDICEIQADEGYDDDRTYDGQGDPEGSEPPEDDAHIYKTIMAAKNKQKLEMERELCEALSLNASILQMKREDMIGEHVLLDGGTSHNV